MQVEQILDGAAAPEPFCETEEFRVDKDGKNVQVTVFRVVHKEQAEFDNPLVFKYDEADWNGLAEVLYYKWLQAPNEFMNADLNRSFKVQAKPNAARNRITEQKRPALTLPEA